MEKLIEVHSFDKITLKERLGKHQVTFYIKKKGYADFPSMSLMVTNKVAYFLAHAQEEFVQNRDKLYIRINNSENCIVNYAYIMASNGLERIDMYGYENDKPIAYIAAPYEDADQLQIIAVMEDIIGRAGFIPVAPHQCSLLDRENRTGILEWKKGMIEKARVVVCNADLDDQACFEMGYAHAVHSPLFSFSPHGLVLNGKIGDAVLAHTKSPGELLDALKIYFPVVAPISIPSARMAEVIATLQAKYPRQTRRNHEPVDQQT